MVHVMVPNHDMAHTINRLQLIERFAVVSALQCRLLTLALIFLNTVQLHNNSIG
ncbi:hypothetical protein BDV18DRAFT_142322 [Aspergillus unguis]